MVLVGQWMVIGGVKPPSKMEETEIFQAVFGSFGTIIT
jgi:hypothetical protein